MKDKISDQTARTEPEQTPKDKGLTVKIGQIVRIRGQDRLVIEEKGQKHGQTQILLKQEV
jgi:hypothetical protein